LVATNDPELATFQMLDEKNLIDLRMVGGTGCELFAEMAFDEAQKIVNEMTDGRCWVQSVTVKEHGANSATCELADTQKIRFTMSPEEVL
jgi:hypothetical protein